MPSNAELHTITTDEQATTDHDAADSTRRCRCCWVTPRATAAATCYGSSCYCCLQPKHHSTETALLYIHDHLINAIGSQKLSCFCLLDLSAAFDTINVIRTSLLSVFLLVVFLKALYSALYFSSCIPLYLECFVFRVSPELTILPIGEDLPY